MLAIIEGLTEYLPVSSTGHLILGIHAMGITPSDFTKTLTIAIQFGAIAAVLVLYWKRFFQSFNFYFTVFIAFVPAVVAGLLLESKIDALLESVTVVGLMLILGGLVFLFIDNRFNQTGAVEFPSYLQALFIGLFQCLALIPGVSRSASTIIGGLTQNLSRKATAEFSFFLAVPTLFGAGLYKLYKYYIHSNGFTSSEISLLLIGNVVSFLVALLAIRSFIQYLTRHGFKIFGYYRIALGMAVLAAHYYYRLSTV